MVLAQQQGVTGTVINQKSWPYLKGWLPVRRMLPHEDMWPEIQIFSEKPDVCILM